MQNNLQVFQNRQFGQMRGYISNNTVYLNLGDVARGLGFVKNDGTIRSRAINRFLKKAGYTKKFNANDFVPESVFYFLAMRTDDPNAEDFQKWLACDVVPTIRKTGSYSVNSASALPAPNNELRQDNINTRKSFTSIVQLYIYYAKNQGDTRQKEKLYSKFTVLANQCAGIINGGRPNATPKQLVFCQQVEALMGNILLRGMQDDKHFSRIESEVILNVNNFAKYIEPTLPLLNEP